MERFMYQEDSFERMLKQKADEYRMYPSDNSWNAIRNRLDNNNRFSWKLASFLTLSFVSLSLWVSVRQHQVQSVTLGNKTNPPKTEQVIAKAEIKNSDKSASIRTNQPVLTTIITPEQSSILVANEQPLIEEENVVNALETTDIEQGTSITAGQPASLQILVKTVPEPRSSSIKPDFSFPSAPINDNASLTVTKGSESSITEPPISIESHKTDGELNAEVSVPVLINSSKLYKRLQFYITPSASYRVLISDSRFTFGNLQDPNAAVIDRSSLGIEAGASILFPISPRLSFRTGVQVNQTKYIVTASRYQQELTTINFTSSGSTQRATNLRTSNGYYNEDVANSTLQVSVPLGLEYRIAGKKQFSFNLGAGVQPTYQLRATGLLVTNDLKNYIKAPDLLSRLNLNSNLETFIRWGSGDLQFQMGPQLRYQLFSNSKGKYPVQEHLVDYGLKFGIIKTLR